MASEAPLTPEHAREYDRLTRAGHAPGRDTLALARKNVDEAKPDSGAAKTVESGATKAVATDAAGGGPEDPVADIAAGVELAKSVKASVGRSSGSSGPSLGSQVQGAYSNVSTPSATSQTLTKIIWAVALGLIVLEIASQATGQFWNFNLNGFALQKQSYQPLAGGTVSNPAVTGGQLATSAANAAGTGASILGQNVNQVIGNLANSPLPAAGLPSTGGSSLVTP